MHLFPLPTALLTLVSSLLLPSLVNADVEFTAPAAGADVPAGTIDVQWKDSGVAPPITSLTAYTLILMTGGNEDSNMLSLSTFVSGGSFRSTAPVSGTIPAGIAGPSENGFFFKIVSSSSTGGEVINYSNRFTITGLTGSTPQQYLSAVHALKGSTTGPGAVGASASASASSTPTGTGSTTSNSKPTSPTTASSGPSSTVSPPVASSGGGISNGALVGIALGGAIIGLLGIGLALYMLWRRRRYPRAVKLDDGPGGPNRSQEDLRKEMSFQESSPPVELDPYATVVEAGDGLPPAEMDSNPRNTIRVELEGDGVYGRHLGHHLTPAPSTPMESLTLDSHSTLALRATEPREQV